MLRLWLERDDLARVRFGPAPSPLGAVVLSTQPLRGTGHGALYDRWRRRTRRALPPHVRALLELVPATGYIPDFLTPVVGGLGLDAELDASRSTPTRWIRADLATAYGK